ncbi:MAG TPA: hypothetical protein VFH33_03295 [Candidatus Krumholzibacteria bacterium]|nr:hypothetical protein [Candidatus Krumholzibacteria bacterium]
MRAEITEGRFVADAAQRAVLAPARRSGRHELVVEDVAELVRDHVSSHRRLDVEHVRAQKHFVARRRAGKHTAARIGQDVDARIERQMRVTDVAEHVVDEPGCEGVKAAVTFVVNRGIRNVGDDRHHAAVGKLNGRRPLVGGQAGGQVLGREHGGGDSVGVLEMLGRGVSGAWKERQDRNRRQPAQ